MKITDVEIRACRPGMVQGEAIDKVDEVDRAKLRGGLAPDVVVVSIKTDEGITGVAFGSGGLDATITARAFAQIKPFFIGRNPMAREKNAQEFRSFDRRWNHSPIYAYGPFDVACWDIAGIRAGLPIHELIGTAADRRAVYVSSMFLASPEEYAAQALEVKARGIRGYKVHPPAPAALDLEVYAAVRDAVGPDYPLMADPVATHSYEEALRVGRELESLGYLWFEEPFYDYDMASYIKLRQKLDIPIAGTETIAGGSHLTAQFIASGAVDIVRTDASWRGGITGALKVARLSEAFGMTCELHTTIYHPLEFANLHTALSMSNTGWFELLYPLEDFTFGLAEPLDIRDGYAYAPQAPGLGAVYDWDAIDNATIEIL
ncbi:mandelate racemase [Nakamurella antarctica]|uniref:Mandelate racemase n=1 Tax=Nakamurella antarctica TaxID=1902245 RepID=A0A3G8ZSU0_9ACTN|nr:enolase C-terminal domain-like protein [Nakamurella antarctica]AZI56851.1 mandelate racemase [Nakamurella antarctica]